MKKIILYILIFVIYVFPVTYGLLTRDELWLSNGYMWLLFGWAPLVVLGGGIEKEL